MKKPGTNVIEEAASRLAALKEEVRLQAHLAGMDARSRWEEELLPELESIEERLEGAMKRSAGEARVQLHLFLMEAHDAWESLEPRVLDVIDRVKAAAKEGEVGRSLSDLYEKARDAVREATKEARAEARERTK